jgi:hypothetical protein
VDIVQAQAQLAWHIRKPWNFMAHVVLGKHPEVLAPSMQLHTVTSVLQRSQGLHDHEPIFPPKVREDALAWEG